MKKKKLKKELVRLDSNVAMLELRELSYKKRIIIIEDKLESFKYALNYHHRLLGLPRKRKGKVINNNIYWNISLIISAMLFVLSVSNLFPQLNYILAIAGWAMLMLSIISVKSSIKENE